MVLENCQRNFHETLISSTAAPREYAASSPFWRTQLPQNQTLAQHYTNSPIGLRSSSKYCGRPAGSMSCVFAVSIPKLW